MLWGVCLALRYLVNIQEHPEKIKRASLLWVIIPLHLWHQIKGSSLHQCLIVNLIITDNYNYLMVGAQIIVINLLGRQFGKGCQYLNGPKQTLQASLLT